MLADQEFTEHSPILLTSFTKVSNYSVDLHPVQTYKDVSETLLQQLITVFGMYLNTSGGPASHTNQLQRTNELHKSQLLTSREALHQEEFSTLATVVENLTHIVCRCHT